MKPNPSKLPTTSQSDCVFCFNHPPRFQPTTHKKWSGCWSIPHSCATGAFSGTYTPCITTLDSSNAGSPISQPQHNNPQLIMVMARRISTIGRHPLPSPCRPPVPQCSRPPSIFPLRWELLDALPPLSLLLSPRLFHLPLVLPVWIFPCRALLLSLPLILPPSLRPHFSPSSLFPYRLLCPSSSPTPRPLPHLPRLLLFSVPPFLLLLQLLLVISRRRGPGYYTQTAAGLRRQRRRRQRRHSQGGVRSDRLRFGGVACHLGRGIP